MKQLEEGWGGGIVSILLCNIGLEFLIWFHIFIMFSIRDDEYNYQLEERVQVI